MIFLQGLFSWSFNSHGPAFSHGLFARSFLMVFSHGLFSWSFLMVFSHGLFSWSFLMVFSHGLFSEKTMRKDYNNKTINTIILTLILLHNKDDEKRP